MHEIRITEPQTSNACTLISVGAIDAILSSGTLDEQIAQLKKAI